MNTCSVLEVSVKLHEANAYPNHVSQNVAFVLWLIFIFILLYIVYIHLI